MTIKDNEFADLQTRAGLMRTWVFRPAAAGRYPGILLFSEIFQITGPIRRTAAEIRADVGRCHYRAAVGACLSCADGYIHRGIEAVVMLLRAARTGVFGQEAIKQSLSVRLPAAVPRSVDKLQFVQLVEYL